jgi:hypothetical protein
MMRLIVVRVTLIRNVLMDDVSLCRKSYINRKCVDRRYFVLS